MNIRPWIVAAPLMTTVLSGALFGQEKADVPIKPAFCSVAHKSGRRIAPHLDIVEFYIPRFAPFRKIADVDYVEYFVRYGPKQDNLWLKFMFGLMVGGNSPKDLANTSITWTARKWDCDQEEDGTDWRGTSADGRRWHHISIPFGFAAYEGVPQKAADYFDRILDTMCCGKCPYCEK